MSDLRVYLFGKFHVQRNDKIWDALNPQKAQELFCYLLLQPDRPHGREKLASVLWENVPDATSRKHLRNTLWQLHSALDNQNLASEDFLLVGNDWIQINPAIDLWVDVAEFRRAYEATHGLQGRELSAAQADTLGAATKLYHADLLEGWYLDWCLIERTRFQNMYFAMLEKLMGHHASRHQYELGITFGMQVLQWDRARERAYRYLMRMNYLSGNRTVALRLFAACEKALREELDVEPSRRTQALYQQICNDRLDPDPDEPAHVQSEVAYPDLASPNVLARLKQWQVTLNQLQHQVQDEINLLERTCPE